MGNRNDPPGLGHEASKSKKHKKHRGQHQERPCPNPPAVPGNVVFTAKVREAKNHLEFSGKVKWDGVFEDEMGQKIPGQGVKIDHYEIQVMPVDVNGDPIDTEDGHPRVRRFHKKAVKGLKVVDAVIVSGTIAEFTTKKAHEFVVDEVVRVQDVKPSGYNGKWTVLAAGLTATKFRADIGVSPAQLEDEGTVEGSPDPNYNIIIEHLSNPRKWRWKARVRAWDNKQCPSDWSDWTTPLLPWTGADPEPPAPGFISLTYDRHGNTKHNPWRGRVKIDPITFWDVPGGDEEDDMAMYHVKVQVKKPGGTWEKHSLHHVRDKDDEKDEDAYILVPFGRIRRAYSYRVWLASSDRFGRRGDYAGPYPDANGNSPGGQPNQVPGVTVTAVAPRRLKAVWDEPTDPEDVDYYKIEWWRRNPLTLMETNRSRNRHDVYRVPKADKGKAHFAKVWAVDIDDNLSTEASSADTSESTDDDFPPGTVAKHAGPGTPSGWLRCNGDSYLVADYTPLWNEIGYAWGGSGANFNVPDFRGRHPIGVGTVVALAGNEGAAETARGPTHTHANDSTSTTPTGDSTQTTPTADAVSDNTATTPADGNALTGLDVDGTATDATQATPGSDSTGEDGHKHNKGFLQTDASATEVPRGTAGTNASGPNHTHAITGDTGGVSTGPHNHGHGHGSHPHNHGHTGHQHGSNHGHSHGHGSHGHGHGHNHNHGGHGHSHNHGGHGHGHAHDGKNRPHNGVHFIIKT